MAPEADLNPELPKAKDFFVIRVGHPSDPGKEGVDGVEVIFSGPSSILYSDGLSDAVGKLESFPEKEVRVYADGKIVAAGKIDDLNLVQKEEQVTLTTSGNLTFCAGQQKFEIGETFSLQTIFSLEALDQNPEDYFVGDYQNAVTSFNTATVGEIFSSSSGDILVHDVRELAVSAPGRGWGQTGFITWQSDIPVAAGFWGGGGGGGFYPTYIPVPVVPVIPPSTPPENPPQVPEPGSMLLLALAFATAVLKTRLSRNALGRRVISAPEPHQP